MRHPVFTIVAALSLLLCIGIAVLWARSYWGMDFVERRWISHFDPMVVEHDAQQIELAHGQIRFSLDHDKLFYDDRTTDDRQQHKPSWSWGRLGVGNVDWDSPPPENLWNRLGFQRWQAGWMSSFDDSERRVWAAPAWLAMAIFALLPAIWMAGALMRQRRVRQGRCPHCGYDLRATPQRCPECGSAGASPSRKYDWNAL